MNIQSEIEQFIINEILTDGRPSLDPQDPLMTNGTLDSLGTLRLITFLEERFGVRIGDGELGEENFGNLKNIARFVASKQSP